jgi:carboxypeptidase Q
MKHLFKAAVFLAAMLLWASPSWAQKERGPSTPEERDKAVKAAHLLETDPFHKDAKKIRQWFTHWIIEVPDISIEICSEYLGTLASAKKYYSTEIYYQAMYSSAAFIIEYPDQAKDQVAVNLAGVEGALKIYESILKTKPKARLEFLDSLIGKREKGELKAYVQEIAQTKCKAKQ